MSNRVSIVRTKFEKISGDISYGFRIYDDYDNDYNNCMDDSIWTMSSLAFLKMLWKNSADYLDETGMEMIDFTIENKSGMYLDDEWLEWDEIKGSFDLDGDIVQ